MINENIGLRDQLNLFVYLSQGSYSKTNFGFLLCYTITLFNFFFFRKRFGKLLRYSVFSFSFLWLFKDFLYNNILNVLNRFNSVPFTVWSMIFSNFRLSFCVLYADNVFLISIVFFPSTIITLAGPI